VQVILVCLIRAVVDHTVNAAERKEKIAKHSRENYRLGKGREVNVKIAVYPGSFDPITNGHLDIVRRAAKMFDRVIVAVAINEEKNPLFSVDERVRLVTDAIRGLRNVAADEFEGLLVEYTRRKRASVVVRGLRAVSDFEFEFQLALMNRKLDSRIETIFLMTKDEYTFISSRQVKEICQLGADVSSFVPRGVERAMRRKFGPTRVD
jgi:pantetheine-phosphate adenylyltransferase